MERINDLKLIKKHYNEKMSHLCRELFPSILETPGLLYNLLTNNFEPSKFLYEDIVSNSLKEEFKDYMYSKIGDIELEYVDTGETPEVLLDKAGYRLYKCETEEDIQKFKKYYASGEELCTFKGGRLNRCHVFFAVKKDVDKIKREDFETPRRQDEYGTSVISIQFLKGKNNPVSIKNRYNHVVDNPDNTFFNNLDNIIPGLTKAFMNCYGYNLSKTKVMDFEIPSYVKAKDDKFYKYNIEIDNKYYCPNNIIIHNLEVKKYDKAKYVIFDDYVLNLQTKSFVANNDSFTKSIGNIERINIEVNKDNKTRKIIINNNIKIELNALNEIKSYTNPNINRIGDDFLIDNISLEKVSFPNVKEVGDNFLKSNKCIKEIDMPNVERVGNDFLYLNTGLKHLSLPKLKETGVSFLCSNILLTELNLPEVEHISSQFLTDNTCLQVLRLPKVEIIDSAFLPFNVRLKTFEAPKLKRIGVGFLRSNLELESLSLPKLEYANHYFLSMNSELKSVYLPLLKYIGDEFLSNNTELKSLDLPSVIAIGNAFLRNNQCLTSIDVSNVQVIGDEFLCLNNSLRKIELSNVREIGSKFFYKNSIIETILAPLLEKIKPLYLMLNDKLQEEIYNRMISIGREDCTFYYNTNSISIGHR